MEIQTLSFRKTKNIILPVIVLILVLTACTRIIYTGQSRNEISYRGNRYKVIKAGDQYWMSENLATSKYRNGRKIPLMTDYSVWPELKAPGCGYYNNDTSKLRKYGMLYNWYAVNTGKICPAGWRVPSQEDWDILEERLGGQIRAGGKMKAVSGWKGRLLSGDDIGFKALPAGYRLNGDFLEGTEGIWWSSTPADTHYFQKVKPDDAFKKLAASNVYIWGRKIISANTYLYTTMNLRENGFAVRCVKAKKVKNINPVLK